MTTSADKLESIKQKFGNLPEDKLLAMVGNLGEEHHIYEQVARGWHINNRTPICVLGQSGQKEKISLDS